ncbi:DarT ssDNA thymidine ADP-ribosyltransferase family protein [Bacillus velezensis]|uniref:DarT ssDNA thymidine ADP-ribosyltransferase family protein n=1 Tax=Bacillus velezensis TaxID=492670 RepID=UPI0034E5E4F5
MSQLEQLVRERKITRLCHFTKSNNLSHILRNESGILANTVLDDQLEILKKNDEHRYDNKEDYVCCSVQYPNSWYLKRIRDIDPLFKEWVVLFIDPILITHPNTLFCHRNAAAGRGQFIKSGIEGFVGMFKNRVLGQRLMYRTHSMAECCPTDDQAEVLLYKNIPRGHIIGIAVPTEEQARREKARLSFIKEVPKDIKWIIAPDLFNVSWSSMVREGDIPEEYYYRREGE